MVENPKPTQAETSLNALGSFASLLAPNATKVAQTAGSLLVQPQTSAPEQTQDQLPAQTAETGVPSTTFIPVGTPDLQTSMRLNALKDLIEKTHKEKILEPIKDVDGDDPKQTKEKNKQRNAANAAKDKYLAHLEEYFGVDEKAFEGDKPNLIGYNRYLAEKAKQEKDKDKKTDIELAAEYGRGLQKVVPPEQQRERTWIEAAQDNSGIIVAMGGALLGLLMGGGGIEGLFMAGVMALVGLFVGPTIGNFMGGLMGDKKEDPNREAGQQIKLEHGGPETQQGQGANIIPQSSISVGDFANKVKTEIDTNKDGFMSKDELLANLNKGLADPNVQEDPKMIAALNQLKTKVENNWDNAVRNGPSQGLEVKSDSISFESLANTMDRDKDGKITLAEIGDHSDFGSMLFAPPKPRAEAGQGK